MRGFLRRLRAVRYIAAALLDWPEVRALLQELREQSEAVQRFEENLDAAWAVLKGDRRR